ncbi:MAG: hypothetical protein AUJ72_01250 [Candidatus Omnitrophica bacterium CG1_02_46_14]|nr:MAG: hypothetical protein AUJ72_01250 [Candidatus Omnitrophica bacterium CG1_02_46_14]
MSTVIYPNFFVIGMERSGTHWVAALLNSHPNIACFPSLPFHTEPGMNNVGEVHFFDTLASLEEKEYLFKRPFEDFLTKYNKVFADLVPLKDTLSRSALYQRFKERFGEYCNEQRGKKQIVGESTPAYVFCLDFMDELYPGISKIAIIRDPKDKIVSWHFNQIRKERKKPDEPITEAFALDYLHERIIPEYRALLAYDKPVHVLTYEYLSDHGVPAVMRMVSFLGREVSEALAQEMLDNASFEKQTKRDSGVERKKGEQDVKSGLRKGVVGDWQNYLTSEIAEKIDAATRELREQTFSKYHVVTS